MSYIKKLEEDYNNGKISLKIIDEKRELYYKLSENEKEKIDKKYGSEPNKKNISKSFDESIVDTKQQEASEIWGIFSIIVGMLYSVLLMGIQSGGDLSRYFRPVEEFFVNFIGIIVIHLFFAIPVWLMSNGNKAKISFWTILILSFLLLLSEGHYYQR